MGQPNQLQTVPELAVIKGSKRELPACFINARKQLKGDFNSPSRIYAQLPERQKYLLCFAAGFSRTQVGMLWHEMSNDQRLSIRDAIIEFRGLSQQFFDAKAIDPQKFIQGSSFAKVN
ncbi:hypothetical protein A7985_05495 [Pseudoalteromonas luteoviolacea]|uniref:Uncharacterized protein n=1 Tax=Pseudoalteromonas luteoviolacea TaxID=43657 RepID=A0A1C0TVQ1_9GAMM|nr:hypothetical protein [Pseudoalteromonas luteoviolacea]OCQ23395.1 hypothetical protein A7985_05495 [Pseudoalteromonas luteoviolacea]